jgi:hypothetical protein
MDVVWNLVGAHPAGMTPCLIVLMEEPKADA